MNAIWHNDGLRQTTIEIDERNFVDDGQLGSEFLNLQELVEVCLWKEERCAAFSHLENCYPFTRLVMSGPDPFHIERAVLPIISGIKITGGARLIVDEGGKFEKIRKIANF